MKQRIVKSVSGKDVYLIKGKPELSKRMKQAASVKFNEDSPFYNAARLIGNNIDLPYLACCDILYHRAAFNEKSFFIKLMKPTHDEMEEYDVHPFIWMTSDNLSSIKNNSCRVLAMLFCDLMYQEDPTLNNIHR